MEMTMRHASPRFAGNPAAAGPPQGRGAPRGAVREASFGGTLLYALLVIAICATGLGAAASVLDVHVADVVAAAMRPIA